MGGTAEEQANTLKGQFEWGENFCELARQKIEAQGGDADESVPLVNGGCVISKVEYTITDTTNCAKVAQDKT